jgi:16S rRNA (cytosine967-C5)-methyltransferase
MDEPALPEAVEQRWYEAWGEDAVLAARRAIAKRPPLDLSFADDAQAAAFVEAHGGTQLAPRNVRIASEIAVPELPGFGEGGWWVQDLAASLPARLIPDDAKDVLDLCAAPGGKTMQMAAAGHSVTALDSSKSRLARLSENLARTNLAANLVTADALEWRANRTYDAILLDAPCSATGTFRRHPEVLYRARPQIISESVERQEQLLKHAAQWLKPGGALVYAVCSLEPAEGEGVVSAFLEAHTDFSILAPAPGELPGFVTSSPQGWVRILPGTLEAAGGLDGFFIARLTRI